MGCCQSHDRVYYVILQRERFIGITSNFVEAEAIFLAQNGAPEVELVEVSTKRAGGIIIKQPIVHYHSHSLI